MGSHCRREKLQQPWVSIAMLEDWCATAAAVVLSVVKELRRIACGSGTRSVGGARLKLGLLRLPSLPVVSSEMDLIVSVVLIKDYSACHVCRATDRVDCVYIVPSASSRVAGG